MSPGAPSSRDLTSWLEWLEQLHPHEIDLGLERVGRVAQALGVAAPGARVITVAGTNGKGSVCHQLAAMLAGCGRRVGLYTSPHLARFNERVRVDGRDADDASLLSAFERVEAARGPVSLTYFEFTTLAALEVFARAGVDDIVLEVGLGGRLDATNVVDPDVAVVTSVALDHAEWLGGDRATIAREKVGIARRDRPLIVGESPPAPGLVEAAAEIGAQVWRAGVDFDHVAAGPRWQWRPARGTPLEFPLPGTGGGLQVVNAATALAALAALGVDLASPGIAEGLRRARVPGRFEIRQLEPQGGPIEVILDVAHNPGAADMLAQQLGARGEGRTLAVLGMYADKDIEGVIAALAPVVDAWFPAAVPPPRGASEERLDAAIRALGGAVDSAASDPVSAFEAARAAARAGDRIVVAGSFATVAPVREVVVGAGIG